MSIRRTTLAGYLLVLVTLCDQLSKYWIYNNLIAEHRGMRVTSFLNFDPVMNKGITFGLLNDILPHAMPGILAVTALVILILLGRWMMRTSSTLIALSLGAIMGGAIGNVIDRVRFGAVIDFLDFYYRNYHYPWAFNIADAAIVTGVTLLVLDSLVRGR